MIRVNDMSIDQLESEVASRGGVEAQLFKLTEAQNAALTEFKSIETARDQIRSGSLESVSAEQITLAFSNCGITLEKLMHDRLRAYFFQNTFRLRKGLSIESARLEIIDLNRNSANT